MADTQAPPPGISSADVDSFLSAQQPAPPAQITQPINSPVNDPAPTGLDEFIAPEMNQEQYGSLEQQAGAALEGAAQGFAGPVATYAETNLLGIPAADIAGRAAANPWTHGLSETAGLIGGAVTGTGEAGLIAGTLEHALPAVAKGAGVMSKIGAGALKGMLEGGLIQGGDEISKSMLGQSDPEAPVASALVNMGAATLLGAGFGGLFGGISGGAAKLKNVAEAKSGTTAAQAVADFGKEWHSRINEPDLLSAVQREVTELHSATSSAADELRGAGGLKDQAIDKLSQNVSPLQLSNHIDEMTQALTKVPKALQEDPLFRSAAETWQSKVTPQIDPITLTPTQTPTPGEVFKATDAFKRQLQEWGQYNKAMVPISEVPFRNAAKSLGHTVRESLENPKSWGDLGTLQKNVNKATADFIPSLKDFNRRFTELEGGVNVVSPGRLNTYVNQLGKPNAEIKQSVMESFVGSAEKYLSRVNDAHAIVGTDRPIPPISMNYTKGTYGEMTPGRLMAAYMFDKGVPGAAEPIASRLGGAELGQAIGGPIGAVIGYATAGRLAPIIEKMIGRPITDSIRNTVIPSVLRAMGAGAEGDLGQIITHCENVSKGANRINNGVSNLFKTSAQQAVNAAEPGRERERLRKYIDSGGLNAQIQSEPAATTQTPAPSPLNFASGGMIPNIPTIAPEAPSVSVLANTDGMAKVLPEQNTMMQAARGRISNYLQSIAPPKAPTKLPFDTIHPDAEKERSYTSALDLANDPLRILNHVKRGDLRPDTMRHFTQMYPELHSHLSKKIQEQVAKTQMRGEKPPYKTRQAMSMFLGTAVDSTFTPQAIIAAQPQPQVAQPQTPTQPASKPKRSINALNKLPTQYQTPNQAASARHGERD